VSPLYIILLCGSLIFSVVVPSPFSWDRLRGCLWPFAWSFLGCADVFGRSRGRSSGSADVCGRLRRLKPEPKRTSPGGQAVFRYSYFNRTGCEGCFNQKDLLIRI
jgi:hypothetical protein